LSEIRLQQGAQEKALENCAQALSIRRTKLGPEHVDVAVCLHHAGKIYQALDRQDDTLQSYSEALSIRRKKLGNDHPDVALVLKDMALVHWNRDMFEDALR
jgi:tetratricopeptide (TPR) repeat protein